MTAGGYYAPEGSGTCVPWASTTTTATPAPEADCPHCGREAQRSASSQEPCASPVWIAPLLIYQVPGEPYNEGDRPVMTEAR